MKLRNKKTGEVIDEENYQFQILERADQFYGCETYNEVARYKSIKELSEEWEDYKTAKPLIKDEKIRKVVKAWAEANDIERVWHECSSSWLRGNGLTIEMENEVDELEQGNYTIAELCGEEEE